MSGSVSNGLRFALCLMPLMACADAALDEPAALAPGDAPAASNRLLAAESARHPCNMAYNAVIEASEIAEDDWLSDVEGRDLLIDVAQGIAWEAEALPALILKQDAEGVAGLLDELAYESAFLDDLAVALEERAATQGLEGPIILAAQVGIQTAQAAEQFDACADMDLLPGTGGKGDGDLEFPQAVLRN